jgi:two-component system sensor histidine kinase UhpB
VIAESLGPHLSEAFQVAVYRMVQECLTNVSRHAGASKVSITLQTKADPKTQRLVVAIEDNGRGFNPKKVSGFGLAGMRERFEGLGAEIKIQSSNKGTSVTALIPLGK